MRKYLDKIKSYAKALKKSAKWNNTGTTVGSLSTRSDHASDYVYEFFCYLSIIQDLKKNYLLEYYPGKKKKANLFPKAPTDKKDRPFFYLNDKKTGKRLYQVCAGTFVKSTVGTNRAPDISFQLGNASRTLPGYSKVLMIYDAKRKRSGSKSKKIGEGQYSYFSTMISELELTNASNNKIKFERFKDFNGNCLITNSSVHKPSIKRNRHHKLKVVEHFDHKSDMRKVKITG